MLAWLFVLSLSSFCFISFSLPFFCSPRHCASVMVVAADFLTLTLLLAAAVKALPVSAGIKKHRSGRGAAAAEAGR